MSNDDLKVMDSKIIQIIQETRDVKYHYIYFEEFYNIYYCPVIAWALVEYTLSDDTVKNHIRPVLLHERGTILPEELKLDWKICITVNDKPIFKDMTPDGEFETKYDVNLEYVLGKDYENWIFDESDIRKEMDANKKFDEMMEMIDDSQED
jgi:hypothetical protein